MMAVAIGLVLAQDSVSIDNAVQGHLNCVRAYVAKLDDGRIPANRLAKLIVPLCHAEHEAAMQASEKESWQRTPEQDRHDVEIEHTLAAIQWARSQRFPSK